MKFVWSRNFVGDALITPQLVTNPSGGEDGNDVACCINFVMFFGDAQKKIARYPAVSFEMCFLLMIED